MKEKVVWDIGVDGPIEPGESLPTMPPIPKGGLLVITGRAPIWRYGQAIHAAHGSPAAAVATFDPRLGSVVVMSHSPAYREGEIIDE